MEKTKGPIILLIDDEEGLRTILDEMLAHVGFSTHIAATGLHAVTKIKAGLTPDLIICDLKMPGMSGLQFIEEYRKLTQNAPTPFILITGYPDKVVVTAAKKLGVRRVMVKPFHIKDLLHEINLDLKLGLNVEELVG